MKEVKKNAGRARQAWLRLILRIFFMAGVYEASFTFLFGWGIQRGNSMSPALKDGELCFTWRPDSVGLGDIVLVKEEGKRRFLRVAAVEGDEVMISDSGFTVNGMIPYGEIFWETDNPGTKLRYPYIVPEGEVFLMNDYRTDLSDSRSWGSIPTEKLEGKIIFSVKRRGF